MKNAIERKFEPDMPNKGGKKRNHQIIKHLSCTRKSNLYCEKHNRMAPIYCRLMAS